MIPIDPNIDGMAKAIYAKDQPGYIPLPVSKTQDGLVVSCWKLSWKERLKALWTGRVYLSLLTFNEPLQPIKLQIGEYK